jgi:hypothetical protein
MSVNKLYQCPYSKATKCNLELPCYPCETFGKYLNKNLKPMPNKILKKWGYILGIKKRFFESYKKYRIRITERIGRSSLYE